MKGMMMRAQFRGMKMGPGVAPVPGPFTVEIVEIPRSRRLPEYRAVLLPTRQRFIDIAAATIETAQDEVAAKFSERLTDWTAI
jgi:hypothetical protein